MNNTTTTATPDWDLAYQQLQAAQKRVELLQEQVQLDRLLLQQDKRNFKRRSKARNAALRLEMEQWKQQQRQDMEQQANNTNHNNNTRRMHELEERIQQQEIQIQTLKQKEQEQQECILSYEMQLLELERPAEESQREDIYAEKKDRSDDNDSATAAIRFAQLEQDLRHEHEQKMEAQRRQWHEQHQTQCDAWERERNVLLKQIQELQLQLQERVKQETQPSQAAVVSESAAVLTPPPTSSTSSSTPPTTTTAPNNTTWVMEHAWHSDIYTGLYTGAWDAHHQCPHGGPGTLRVDDGTVLHCSQWQQGQLHQHGVIASMDGDLYYGAFQQGRKHGHGVLVWSDGRLYIGLFRDGLRECSDATMTWPYGATYQGSFQHDKRNGHGVYVYADGRCYTGMYQDDRPHGQGTLTDRDGNVLYQGQWELGEFLPHGVANK